MSVNYLVDYENVHEAGLYGMSSLAAEDCVYVFHTRISDRITMSCFDDVRAWVKVILVPPGKQSLDMHLGSFLGYLIGKEEDPETEYAIVSHDTDYRGIRDFWNRACHRYGKVQCVGGLIKEPGTVIAKAAPAVPPAKDSETEHRVIRDFIIRAFSKTHVFGPDGMPFMLVSELCSMLNCLPEYRNARRRLNMKPMQFLEEECRDVVLVSSQWQKQKVYLIADGQVYGSSESMKKDLQQETKAAAEELLLEEELPDILEMGDLELPDFGEAEETFAAEEAVPVISICPDPAEPVCDGPAEDAAERPDFLAAALECIRETDGTEKNACGDVRASTVRDRLMALPEFRSALKASGMKPIPFMQQLFDGKIRIRREKGIFWAAPDESPEDAAEERRVDELAERRKIFLERAFSNIQQRLSDAGLAKETADEIADIFIHSDSAAEPRKVIHEMLCRRFGTKIGARYYRQTVQYMSM